MELSYIGYNAYNVSKLDISVCEFCYEEVQQKVDKVEHFAALWVRQRNAERKHTNTLSN
jgi:hypothetical protein